MAVVLASEARAVLGRGAPVVLRAEPVDEPVGAGELVAARGQEVGAEAAGLQGLELEAQRRIGVKREILAAAGARRLGHAAVPLHALPGAEVWLDGNGLGGGPIQVELAPGDHQVEVRARKRVPLVLTLALDQAETTVRVAGERLRRPRWRLLAGGAAAGAGP